MKPIAVAHVSTYDARGGAGIAASRLHLALRAAGAKSSHLVRFKTGIDPHTYIGDVADYDLADESIIARAIQSELIDKRRTVKSNTLFSLAYPGIDITKHPVIARSDVINLHWVSSFQSIESIRSLLALGKPIVWTLHDQQAFTGGCHYSAGCYGFTQDCAQCPQLASDRYGLASSQLQDRIDTFSSSQCPVIVTPSEWLRQCASRSQVFRNAEIITIPNSVPVERFNPGVRSEARRLLGIDGATQCILFGAESHQEKRKGFADLISAIRLRLADPITAKVLKQATILCFGEPSDDLSLTGLRITSLGRINDESRLRQAYAASDIFVLPSNEDNLPNTILESLACGTPVLAFSAGGIPEAVRHGETGWLIPTGDCGALGMALTDLLTNPTRLQEYSLGARSDAVERFSPSVQAQRYLDLYDNLLRQKIPSRVGSRAGYVNGAPFVDLDRTASFDQIFHSAASEAVLPAYVRLVKEHEFSEGDRYFRGEQIDSLTAMLQESETDRRARGEQIDSLTAMLRILFSRPAFRWLTKFSSWPELKELAKRIGAPNE